MCDECRETLKHACEGFGPVEDLLREQIRLNPLDWKGVRLSLYYGGLSTHLPVQATLQKEDSEYFGVCVHPPYKKGDAYPTPEAIVALFRSAIEAQEIRSFRHQIKSDS